MPYASQYWTSQDKPSPSAEGTENWIALRVRGCEQCYSGQLDDVVIYCYGPVKEKEASESMLVISGSCLLIGAFRDRRFRVRFIFLGYMVTGRQVKKAMYDRWCRDRNDTVNVASTCCTLSLTLSPPQQQKPPSAGAIIQLDQGDGLPANSRNHILRSVQSASVYPRSDAPLRKIASVDERGPRARILLVFMSVRLFWSTTPRFQCCLLLYGHNYFRMSAGDQRPPPPLTMLETCK